MFGNRKLKAENARLHAELRRAVDERTEARADADQARQVQQFQIVKRAEVEQGAQRVQDQNRVLRERLEDLRDGTGLDALDADYERLDQVHQRAKQRIVRYVTELRQLRLQAAAQQRQLDDALGMDHPDIEAGRGWRARRPDKAPPKLRAASSPSGPLPTREPGVVDTR